jgi:hypothetical protein
MASKKLVETKFVLYGSLLNDARCYLVVVKPIGTTVKMASKKLVETKATGVIMKE